MNFDAINQAAMPSLEDLAREVDPGCRREASEIVLLNPHTGDRTRKNFSINRSSGTWKDFAASDIGGGDLVSFWAYCKGLSQKEAGQELAKRFGVAGDAPGKPWKGPKEAPVWVPRFESEEPPYQAPPDNPTRIWTYRDELGRALFQRPRYDHPGGKKEVKYWGLFRQLDGSLSWMMKAPPKPWPLYGLDRLQGAENGVVLVVEGEKAADAANDLFPRMAVVTSGGADSASSVDWTPLRGRQVVLWPDHDEPGKKYAGAVAAQLKGLGITLRVVGVPDQFPDKWDLADPVPAGVLPSDLQQMIGEARPWNGEALQAPRALNVLCWSDLKNKAVPPVRYVWDPYFPVVPFGILASHPGHGKSLLSLQIAVSVATGMPLFGSQTCGPAGVGVLALEDDQNVIHRRLKAITEAYGSAWTPAHDTLLDQNLRVMVRARTPLEGLDSSGAAFELAHLAKELGETMRTTQDPPAILFLDTLNAVHDGDEKDATASRPLISTIFGLNDALGCSVWALHHLRKSGNSKSAPALSDRLDPELVRGSSALVGGARAVVQFGWILPVEAAKVGLEPENSSRLYTIVGLTKVNDGPLSPWMLLEHSKMAGLWVQTLDGDQALASLRGGKAVEDLNQAESILLEIHRGLSRKEIAEKIWPGDEKKAQTKFKTALQNLRRRTNWIQPLNARDGKPLLTLEGFKRAQELSSQLGSDDYLGGVSSSESESYRESA